ncbi:MULTISPECIES: MarR family winged helix-turn-helix transcriptional regulator [Eubacterium]|uniref:DNA-binding transcriptional regulator, MarR family n=1 Tax=Eubacterium barkeri TaxID=1528 RepID=A0A1H3D2F1_EUBBA|nr:MarR family transcriptional regulator [Eubacterium barkeri]SDX59829.1 DNA-binding transcriptional regulator, MarR family [Eubacterium barkeri]
MKQYHEILEKVIELTNVMNKTSKCARDFGVGILLYPAEIHTIEAIGAHESINANALAKLLGITNGAVTQTTNKLLQKGLVEKFKVEGNQKAVYLKLTALGRTAEQAHDHFHAQSYQNVIKYLSSLSQEHRDAILAFLDVYIENLPRK